MNDLENRPVEELNYEEALAELETIVTALENGEGSLESALTLFERGQALARRCADLLENAELKVSLLSGEQTTPFEPEN